MKKFVVETIVKEVDNDIENVIDRQQFVSEVEETINVTETYIVASGSLTFSPFQGGTGARSVRIISDLPLKMSFTSMDNSYDFGCYMKEITLLGDEEDTNLTPGFVAKYGSITLANRNTENRAKIKIIYVY